MGYVITSTDHQMQSDLDIDIESKQSKYRGFQSRFHSITLFLRSQSGCFWEYIQSPK